MSAAELVAPVPLLIVRVEGRRRAAALAAYLEIAGYASPFVDCPGRDRYALLTDATSAQLAACAPAWTREGADIRAAGVP